MCKSIISHPDFNRLCNNFIPSKRFQQEYLCCCFISFCSPLQTITRQFLHIYTFFFSFIYHCRFPNDTELHLIMRNQFSPISVRFKPTVNSKRIDQTVECLIQIYNEVNDLRFTKKQTLLLFWPIACPFFDVLPFFFINLILLPTNLTSWTSISPEINVIIIFLHQKCYRDWLKAWNFIQKTFFNR